MALSPGVIALVLLAALCHASWNALVKSGADRLVMMNYTIGFSGVISFFIAPFVPLPAAAAWPFLIGSTLIHLTYYASLIYAYKHGDLSQVYPIARGSAPVIVAAGAWLAASEALSPAELLGVLIVSGGIVSLAWRGRRQARPDGEVKAVGFALLTACAIGGYSLVDGMGVRRAGNAASYIVWLFIFEIVPLFAFTWYRRRGRLVAAFAPHLKIGLIGGVIAGTAYAIAIWAMSQGPMAHVVALRETSVIMAAIIGALVLKEPFGPRRIAAAAVVTLGALLLQVG
ncbi:MAG: EamA family transporter [Pseudomonadota bacterium]